MATYACRGEHIQPVREIAFSWRQSYETLSFHLGADWNARREECQVGDDVVHVAPRSWKRSSIHTADEAVVDAILDDVHLAAAHPELRKTGIAPDPWHDVLSKPVVQV